MKLTFLESKIIRFTGLFVGAVLLMLAGALGYQYLEKSQKISSMPDSVRDELTFSPLVIPTNSSRYTSSNYKAAAVEDGTQVLTFLLSTERGTITVTEHIQPPAFSEIPEYKQQFLSDVIQQYATVQTANGTLYLGRGTKGNDRQIAVLLERGLVVFMTPENPKNEFDENAWRALGETLEIEKINN